MVTSRNSLTRSQILAYRRRVGGLDERASHNRTNLRQAAWAGLQDSMPRAALLSIHARVANTPATVLSDPSLIQIWGPRFSAYAIARADLAVFTLGRLPDRPQAKKRASDLADRLELAIGDEPTDCRHAARAIGVSPNFLRYAAPSGRVLISWDGARQPTVWTVPTPDLEPASARLELVRRYLHIFGPSTAESFAAWAGVQPKVAVASFDSLRPELRPVRTPIGDRWILASDEAALRAPGLPATGVRLLPSGDAYYLLQGPDRDLLVEDPHRRDSLWTSRVWPGAVLLDGEIVGVWRRSQHKVTIEPWGQIPSGNREAIADEAAALPLPGLTKPVAVHWDD